MLKTVVSQVNPQQNVRTHEVGQARLWSIQVIPLGRTQA